MPDFAIAIADPLGIGTLDGSNLINVTEIAGGPQKGHHEVIAGNGKYIASAVKELRPIEEWNISYELLDAAAFSIAFGVAVNTDYLVSSFTANCGPEVRPTVNVTVIKPSTAAKIKSYFGAAVSVSLTGGFGIVEKWGATSTSAFVSSSGSIEMLTAEAMEETSGDFLDGGILHWGFKRSINVEAYGAITIPAGAHAPDAPTRHSRDGWKTFATSYWNYLDAA